MEMAFEATIVEKMQELRRWQIEQQEKLIRQQQEQREMLSNEQNRMYQALSLSVEEMSIGDQSLKELLHEQKKEEETSLIDFDTPDEECSSPAPQRSHSFSLTSLNQNNNTRNLNLKFPNVQLSLNNMKTSLYSSSENNNSYNQHDYSSEMSIDGLQSFCSEKSQKLGIPIDEMPVPSPKKDFNTLLEERLKESEAINIDNRSKSIVKRPFLKKGQGLARFMPNSNTDKSSKSTTRPRSASFSTASLASNSKPSKAITLERCNSLPKSKRNEITRKSIATPITQPKLTFKNVPPPRKKPCSRSASSVPTTGAIEKKKSEREITSDTNSSDLEVKNKRELEEMRIFELLEDKAENSSFCSTSSTVIAFLQQSTPLKQKALLHSASKQRISLEDIGDETLEEIVQASKSHNFLLSQKNCKNQKLSQWDTVPLTKLKNDKTVVGTVLPYGTDVDPYYEDYPANKKVNEDDNNVSLHVRFSEYNEYKTMTDASSISSDSQTIINYINDKGVWSDGSVTPDSSDVESNETSYLKTYNKGTETLNFLKKDQEDSDIDETEVLKNEEEEEEDEDEDENENENEGAVEDINVTLQKTEAIIDEKNETTSLFRSELLKSRLVALEQEIEMFRKESAALAIQRQKVQEERTKLQEERIIIQRTMKEKEEAMEIEKRKMESILKEERTRLAREKAALESRMKDAWERAQKSKQERQEIQTLRDQLEELQEECIKKESKWSAANARQRSQMRVLQTENSKLKQELEKLQQKQNSRFKKAITSSNTKAIHQINKFLAERKKISPFKNDEAFFEDQIKLTDNADTNCDVDLEVAEEKSQEIEKVKMQKTAESIARTRNLYESLLKDATEGLTDVHIERRNLMNQCSEIEEEMADDNLNSNDQNYDKSNTDEEKVKTEKDGSNNTSPKSPQEVDNVLEKYDGDRNNKVGYKNFNNKQGIREVHHPDGRIEYWYPNGNVKKVFPDKCLTKMIYYNGDVRETDKNGIVKYFYTATRTWHTTMPDGLEILEFPDGQVERRSKNGTTEVAFPDGSVKIVQADGSEKWALRDGTLVETSTDGEKVLTLPNGQREIHTKDHKRREYPDGTVKLVYPDGVQETRYANGRVRLKDKDGNLIMDTHQ